MVRAADDIRGWLIDLDGTLACGGQAMPGAAAFLRACEERFAVVSNDAEHTPTQLSVALRRMGLDVAPSRIVLAGAAALDGIAIRRPGARVLMLASRALENHARERGLRPVRSRPDLVFLGRDRSFGHARLALAANAVRTGAELVVANPDLVHPGPGGTVVPETGALLAALLACTGPMEYDVIGKPEPALFELALALLGLPKRSVAMLGDNPRTDGEGARRFGIRYVDIAGGGFPSIEREETCPGEAAVVALPA